jgi:uncharacterized membrane protein
MKNIFSFLFGRKQWFTPEQSSLIEKAISEAEQQTSGEIRVYIESKCAYLNSVDRAVELFEELGMMQTAERNGVLVYLAMNDHQLAVIGDKGIHEKVGAAFWEEEVQKMIAEFRSNHLAEGLVHLIYDVGQALKCHFPYTEGQDKNELPDQLIFGK